MSAREAYIAGRSGGSRPKSSSSTGSPGSSSQRQEQQDREQKSFDAGQQERQREQILQSDQGINDPRLSQDQREEARSIAEQTGKDPYDTESRIAPGGGFITPEETPIQKFDNFMTSFGNVKFPTLPTPFGFGIEALKGFDSTNRFFKNLNTKKSGSLSNQDKITLINLVKAGGEGSGLQYLEKWANDNDLSEEEIRDLANKFTGEYSNIGSSISDSGIMEYLDTKPEGIKDSVAAMLGQYRDEDNPGPNLEYVTDNLGTVGLEYLKATNPAAFYALRPAATSNQMEELAGMALTGNKDFDNKIFAAREAARERKNQGGGGSGIMGTQMAQQTGTTDPGYDMSIYGSRIGQKGPFTMDFIDQDGDGSDDRYQSGPGQGGPKAIPKENFIGGIGIDNMGIRGGVPSLTPTTIDYASMGPQYGGYVNQGISDPRFASYFQNLNLFPRRS